MSTRSTLQREIQAFQSLAEDGRWHPRAAWLLDQRKGRDWPARGPDTFGRYLERMAFEIGVAAGSLWRELKAAAYVEQVLARYGSKEGDPLYGCREQVAGCPAAHLDIVERIAEVAPDKEAFVLEQVLTGRMSRADLLAFWEALRPMLSGPTPRGRNERAAGRGEIMAERTMLAMFKLSVPGWMSARRVLGYEVFYELPMTNRLRLDGLAILYTEDGDDSELEFHGLEFKTQMPRRADDFALSRLSGVLDYMWLMLPASGNEKAKIAAGLPAELGIALLSGDGPVTVLRRAGRLTDTGTDTDRKRGAGAVGTDTREGLMREILKTTLKKA